MTPSETTNVGRARPRAIAAPVRANRRRPEPEIRTVAAAELPIYTDVARERAEHSIAELPPGKLWFTYSDVRASFGVSRATVVRKLREGLVPGIRMNGARVLEDGPVRRFDRDQLLWLLLAVRSPRR